MPLAYVFGSKKAFATKLAIQEHALMPNHNKYVVAFFDSFFVARGQRWPRRRSNEKYFINLLH